MSNQFIVDSLLSREEGIRLEFKSAIDIMSIAKGITAMINSQGGDMLVGVTNNKAILGLDIDRIQIEELKRYLIDRIKPTAPISFKEIDYKGKNLLLISVWEGGHKPYHFENKIYHRQGSRTYLTKSGMLNDIISAAKKGDFNWERQSLLGVEFDDLDTSEIKLTKELYLEYHPTRELADEEDFLIDRGLLRNGNVTNASMVLFGKNPSRYIRQSTIRVIVYEGNQKGSVFLEDQIYDQHIFNNIESILKYLDSVYGNIIKVDGIKRSSKKNYPELALREGIMNAIVHRDYNSNKGFMKISIYNDRTVISNYGELPEGLTTKDLSIEHESILRNPDLAYMCFYRKYIEMLGTGTLRMISDCKATGFDKPMWKQKDSILELTFPGLGHGKGEGVNEGVNEGINTEFEGVSEGVKEELLLLLDFIGNNPGKKVKDISKVLNKGISTVERYIRTLKEHDAIEFVGVPKTGGYFLKKER